MIFFSLLKKEDCTWVCKNYHLFIFVCLVLENYSKVKCYMTIREILNIGSFSDWKLFDKICSHWRIMWSWGNIFGISLTSPITGRTHPGKPGPKPVDNIPGKARRWERPRNARIGARRDKTAMASVWEEVEGRERGCWWLGEQKIPPWNCLGPHKKWEIPSRSVETGCRRTWSAEQETQTHPAVYNYRSGAVRVTGSIRIGSVLTRWM